MLKLDWRQAAQYQQAEVIAVSGIAWEYLRREEAYHRDFQRLNGRKAQAATALEAFSERWGLRFPPRPAGDG